MRTLPYGDRPEQVGDLYLPANAGPHPVVVLWHGGSYAAEYGRDMLAAAAEDLAALGLAAWNVTYRRLGSGGGWPQTFDDARTAVDALRELDAPLDLDDVTALGFSAGAPLALRLTTRYGSVRPRRVVSLAGVAMLEVAARASGGDSSVARLLGEPDDSPAVYREADPAAHLPLGVPSLHVHGAADELVPVALSEAFVRAARVAGDDEAELVVVPGAGHFDVQRPGTAAWAAVARWLGGRSGAPA